MFAAELAMTLNTVHGDPAVLDIAGEIDLGTAEQLRTRLVGLVEDGRHPRLVVDLSNVSFCDAAGLGALVHGLNQKRGRPGWLRLSGLQPPVARVFRITALDQVFAIYPTREEAVRGGRCNVDAMWPRGKASVHMGH